MTFMSDKKVNHFVANGEMWNREDLTLEEFAKAIMTSPDCWIFKQTKDPKFYKWSIFKSRDKDRIGKIVYEMATDDTRDAFKYMPEYGEIWHRDVTNGGLWSTWKEID